MRHNHEEVLDTMRRSATLARRFWAGVTPCDGPNACWEWRSPNGGDALSLSVGRYKISVDRISWFLSTGELPAGGHVTARCGNERCVRPSHLAWGLSQLSLRRVVGLSNGYAEPAAAIASPDRTDPRQARTQLRIPRDRELDGHQAPHAAQERARELTHYATGCQLHMTLSEAER